MQVHSRGQLLTEAPIHAGSGVTKVTGLASGDRNVKVVVAATTTTTRVVVRQPVTVS